MKTPELKLADLDTSAIKLIEFFDTSTIWKDIVKITNQFNMWEMENLVDASGDELLITQGRAKILRAHCEVLKGAVVSMIEEDREAVLELVDDELSDEDYTELDDELDI